MVASSVMTPPTEEPNLKPRLLGAALTEATPPSLYPTAFLVELRDLQHPTLLAQMMPRRITGPVRCVRHLHLIHQTSKLKLCER